MNWDDDGNFALNGRIRELSIENMKWYWTDGVIYFVWEPISLIFKALVFRFLGSTAPVNYDANVFLHGVNVLLSRTLVSDVR